MVNIVHTNETNWEWMNMISVFVCCDRRHFFFVLFISIFCIFYYFLYNFGRCFWWFCRWSSYVVSESFAYPPYTIISTTQLTTNRNGNFKCSILCSRNIRIGLKWKKKQIIIKNCATALYDSQASARERSLIQWHSGNNSIYIESIGIPYKSGKRSLHELSWNVNRMSVCWMQCVRGRWRRCMVAVFSPLAINCH